MKSLATYIEYLIMSRHFAFVPGLGAFMIHEVPAHIETIREEQSGVARFVLTPPTHVLSFNRLVTHDDGVLANTYMEFEECSYDEAQAQIHHEVAQWLRTLEEVGSVVLGTWGRLDLDEERRWSFTATHDATTQTATPHHYGLATLTLNQWQQPAPKVAPAPTVQHPATTAHDERLVLPITRYVAQRMAMIVLILCTCFSGFLPYSRIDRPTQEACVIDSEILSGDRMPYMQVRHTWEETWEQEIALSEAWTDSEATQITAEAVPLTAELSAPETIVSTTTQAVPTTEDPQAKRYYIIIGSCTTEEEATAQCARLRKSGVTDVGILLKDDRYRLYINDFADRSEAESYLSDLRAQSSFHDAWLLPARSASLKHISKIKHNEQLPMELSHLTTGTKRDAGGNLS